MNVRLSFRLAHGVRALALVMLLVAGHAGAFGIDDPLDTDSAVSDVPPATPLARHAAMPCMPDDPATRPATLSLLDAVQRALCSDPRTREAWADIRARQAELGADRAAYLPTLSANGSLARVDQHVTYSNFPGLESSLNTHSTSIGVNLSWVLYDFGLRAANLEHARQLLNAAIASRDQTLQTVFLDTVHAYYDAQTKLALFDAARETERVARESFDTAQAKFTAGVATLADKLQAQTAYTQATLRRMQAHSDLRGATGALAIAMGLNPGVALPLPAAIDDGVRQTGYPAAIDALIDEALSNNPGVRAAQAQLQAAQAQVRAARRQNRPKISLLASADRSDTPITEVTSEQVITNRSIGIQISIPIFDGFSRQYRIREADADVDRKQAELAQIKRTVSLDVWQSREEFTAGLDNLKTADALLASAKQSVGVALGRYKAGVGTLLELLRAQSDLADAERQRILALTRWENGRFKLAASLGRLGIGDIH